MYFSAGENLKCKQQHDIISKTQNSVPVCMRNKFKRSEVIFDVSAPLSSWQHERMALLSTISYNSGSNLINVRRI